MFGRTQTAPALALLTLMAACVHVDESAPADPYTYEVESNDFAFCAQGIGPIAVGQRFLVRGHISDQGYDPFDGFAFLAKQPMDVEFALYADDPSTDFDVQLFDPYTGNTVASWETGANPEGGRFSVLSYGMEFHLVVNSFSGSGEYTFEVRGAPLSGYGLVAGTGFAALGAARQADRAGDWTGYGGRKNRLEVRSRLPRLQMTTLSVDPQTGQTRIVKVRQLLAPVGLPNDF